MRKALILGAGGLLCALSGSAAVAADASPDFSWSGGYIGAVGGYGWSNDHATDGFGGADAQVDPRGWVAGGHLGFNWEFDNGAVFGIEGEGLVTGEAGSTGYTYGAPVGATTASEKIQAMGSVRARFGGGIGMVMPYAIGGFAVAYVSRATQTTTVNKPFTGWTAGAGLEIAASQHVSLRGEYGYYDFGTQNFAVPGPSGGTNVHLTSSVVTGSINLRF